MQFVLNGPDIPERLLKAPENGSVVFCDAEISCSGRLPNFTGLVEKLYVAIATTPDTVYQKRNYFDQMISTLKEVGSTMQ